MDRSAKLALATFVAPFPGAFTTRVGLILLGSFDTGWAPIASNAFYLLVEVPSLLAALMLPWTVALGLPIHALLVRIGYPRSLGYIFCGVIGGLFVGALMSSVLSQMPLSEQGNALAFTATGGGVTAAYFWLIRRPDRDAANLATPAP